MTAAPYDSDRVPRPTRDSLPAAVQELADVLGRPMLAKRLAEKLEPVLLVELTARVRDIAARASLTAEDRVSAEVIDRMMAESLARLAAQADDARASRRTEELLKERYEGASRLA